MRIRLREALSVISLMLIGMTLYTLVAEPVDATRGRPKVCEEIKSAIDDSITQGRFDEAAASLRQHLSKHPEHTDERLILGQLYYHTGRSDEAVAAILEGASEEDPDSFEQWVAAGSLREQQARSGPNIHYDRGYVVATPPSDDVDEEAWVARHFELARDAFETSVSLRADSSTANLGLGRVLIELRKFDRAIEVLQSATRKAPDAPEPRLHLARALRLAERNDEALDQVGALLRRHPDSVKAQELRAEVLEALGQSEEARLAHAHGAFYGWLVPGSEVPYTKEHAATVETLNLWFEHRSSEPALEERRTLVEAALRELAQDPSESAAELLAAFAYHHSHDDLEDFAMQSLEARGAAGIPTLINLLKNAGSVCTVRNSSHALARLHAPDAFGLLIKLLDRDTQPFFVVDAAGALATLGNGRAVPHLIRVLEQPLPQSEDDGGTRHRGVLEAKVRSIWALGSFDTPAAREALLTRREDQVLGLFAKAALYRMTSEQQYLDPLAEALRENAHEAGLVASLLKDLDQEEAQRLSRNWESERGRLH